MSRLMTLSELYSLLLQHADLEKPSISRITERQPTPPAVVLNQQSPVLWLGNTSQKISMLPPRPLPRSVKINSSLMEAVGQVAAASGISESEAWAEAAEAWIVQRQHDMEELASPSGQELAHAVQHVWTVIDDQLRDLRGEAG